MLKSKKFWGIISSFLFLWLALYGLDFQKIPNILESVNWVYIPLIFLSMLFEHLTRGIRWKVLLNGRSLSVKNSFYATALGYFFNNIFPARAGEFIKAWYLKKKCDTNFGEAVGSVVIERFLDGVLTLGLMCFSLNLFTSTPFMKKAAITTLVFYSLILVGIVSIYFRKNDFEKLANRIFSLLPQKFSLKLSTMFNSFMNGLIIATNSFKVFIGSIAWTIIAWGFTFLTHYLFVRMLNMDLNLSSISFIMVVAAIGAMIPGSPGNLGIYEYSCVLAIHNVLNYSHELGATFGILTHTLNYAFVAVEGFIVLTLENLSIKEIQEKQKESESKEKLD